MKQYETFIFDTFDFSPELGKIGLQYTLSDEVNFLETLILPSEEKFPIQDSAINSPELEQALFMLHLIGGISYYKTCLPKKMEIRPYGLSKSQTGFWNAVYKNGLGEFFYNNKIDPKGLINFPSSSYVDPTLEKVEFSEPTKKKKRILVPVGGGKDSLVTIELLRKAGHEITLFRVGSHPFIEEMAKVAGLPLLIVERHLAQELFNLNKYGALNGHVPITAYLHALTVVLAILYGFDAVAFSDERSADEGNVEYLGQTINHQWSKSLEFERLFQTYVREFVTPDVEVFSPLRPMSELMIAKRFAEFPKYFPHVTSCNANWRILKEKPKERWCGKCPKCAFVFTLFAAFIPKDQVVSMFGKNLFEDESLLPLYRELLNIEGFKPFECVGTPEETLAALVLAQERNEWGEPPVIKMAMEEVDMPDDVHALIEQELTPSEEHAIPEEFQSATAGR